MAQSTNKVESVAAVSADQTEVRWQPQVEYARLILTVSIPGGEVVRQEFEAGAHPSFKVIDKKGFNLPDGQYVYELRVVPNFSKEVKKALAASREKGNSDEVMRDLQSRGQLPATVTVQSGSFRIEKGMVFTGAPEEGIEPPNSNSAQGGAGIQSKKKGGGTVVIQDIVQPDDVIVQGSLCVGLDCVNNESFGFDTIRLKENNTRIKFEDTSTATGFPSTDWQLTANDSASGGQNKFSIEDITDAKVPFTITGNAPTNSIFVDSTGRVGLRTSTPVLDLHISTSNTPAHRLEQTNAGGFVAQTWDVAGNEANFFVRDVTGGSRLPFRIRPGAPTSSIDINASGNVGLGTASPFSLNGNTPAGLGLHISGSAVATSIIDAGSVGAQLLMNDRSQAVNSRLWRVFLTGGDIQFASMNDALSAKNNVLALTNSGNVGIGTTAPAGKLDVNGSIFQRGVQLFADYVFEPTYTLESIEDHAAFMWNNKHLPAVGARKVDEQGREVVEIGARMRALLEELEKAHIYISTLNGKVSERDEKLVKLEQQNAELAERLTRIEAMLSASKSEKK
jgi:hypothetical protein